MNEVEQIFYFINQLERDIEMVSKQRTFQNVGEYVDFEEVKEKESVWSKIKNIF